MNNQQNNLDNNRQDNQQNNQGNNRHQVDNQNNNNLVDDGNLQNNLLEEKKKSPIVITPDFWPASSSKFVLESNLINISVKTLRGQTFELKVNAAEKVDFLKYLIEADSDDTIMAESIIFLQSGKIVNDETIVSKLQLHIPLIIFPRQPTLED
jgi:hypothetical protein